MIYITADIHGCYNEFIKLLKEIDLKDEDTLYILGDVIDRGPEPIKCLLYIMEHPNIKLIMGNHDEFLYNYLKLKEEGLTKSRIFLENRECWFRNGGEVSLSQLSKESEETRDKVLEYLKQVPYYVQLEDTLLVHAGIYPYELEQEDLVKRQLEEDLIWIRNEFIQSEIKLPFKVIFGHTPTCNVLNSILSYNRFSRTKIEYQYEELQHIYFNNKIGIDGGCCFGGYLLALRLDDMKEYIIKSEQENKFVRR